MRVTVSIEQRFDRTPDGATWTSGQFAYDFWAQYLAVFDEVRVLARVRDVESVPEQYKAVDGAKVTVRPLPHYVGPLEYLAKRSEVQKAARRSASPDGAYILRTPSQIASVVQPLLQKARHPYGVEVVGDPYDVFAPGVIKHPLAPFCRLVLPRRLKAQCADAAVAAYVTEKSLQQRYPCSGRMFAFSDVQLSDDAVLEAHRHYLRSHETFSLVFVGTFTQLYKAPDAAIEAVAECVRDGLDLELVMVGEGPYRPKMEALAARLGLNGRVRFTGQLAPADVRRCLNAADLFVLPSRTEGLPRAIIEAMARGLPCIASTVGGIPELLPQSDLVPPGDASALARKIKEVLANPRRLEAMSRCNLESSQRYRLSIVLERKREFLQLLKEITTDARTKRRRVAASIAEARARTALSIERGSR